jgi:glutamate/tyrosine decarboxylase-like PLP-dependent enzyme
VGAFAQTASYLEAGRRGDDIDPMDLAFHLTRRPRGLPFWFSLMTHGTDRYAAAARRVLRLTQQVAADIRRRDSVALVLEPELSIILVRRHGWSASDYTAWCAEQCRRQTAFVQPDTWREQPVLRLCFLNPETQLADVTRLIDSLDSAAL